MDSDNSVDDVFGNYDPSRPARRGSWGGGGGGAKFVALALFALIPILVLPYFIYTQCRIEVPNAHMAILLHKVGEDIENGDEIAPDETYRGVQKRLLAEGRHYYNPYLWSWVVLPQIEIPAGKLGVRTRLYGDNLAPGDLIAWEENQKGIVPKVLNPGRHAINARVIGDKKRRAFQGYAETIELFDPITIPAGFKGVVTKLAAPMPDDPNVLLVEEGRRGVQKKAFNPGTYYVNPYVTRINLVDCRKQVFDLGSDDVGTMGFPSKDGFWIRLRGEIQFNVKPEEAPRVFVVYNDTANGEKINDEIINKIILPNARSFCRLHGSNYSGRDFIGGGPRSEFQAALQKALAAICDPQGIEISQVTIGQVEPPEAIAAPVNERQIAIQTAEQYTEEILQQASEKQLGIEKEMVNRKKALVEADQEVVKVVTEANRKKEVARIQARQRLAVAEFEFNAAEDLAEATLARGKAAAAVIQFNNEAQAAGWKKSVEAFSGDGNEFARWVLMKKLAPAFRSMMINTADSPMMDIFETYNRPSAPAAEK